MTNQNSFRATQYLPQVAVATTFVAVLPVVVVWILLAKGVISSPWVCVAMAIALSLIASIVGSAYWKRRSGPGDVLFSELLLWGWLHRWRSERRLANAVGLLGLTEAEQGLSGGVENVKRKAEILRQMATALDAQDPYTDGHSRRVALHAAMIARKMGLSREEVAKVRTAAAVHDVGKLRIPMEVLNKPGPLTTAEFEIVKRHADDGAAIVSAMEEPDIEAMVRHHHEHFDGSGYPGGLVGEQSPVGARIIAVADTFDALTSERPYRAGIQHKRALEIILAASGSQLDPVAVRAFLKCYSGKRAIFFWTLLAVSPQRAIGLLSGRSAGRTTVGPASTVAMPAALAAVVVTVFGGAASLVAPRDPTRLAQHSSPQIITSGVAQTGSAHHSAPARSSSSAGGGSPQAKQAVLGTTVTRRRSSGTGRGSRGPGAVRHTGSPGTPGVGGSSGSGSGNSPAGGTGGKHDGGSHHGTSNGSGTAPTVIGTPTSGGTPSGSNPPATSPPATAGAQAGGGPTGGNQGTGGSGNGGGGSSGNPGAGDGGGNGQGSGGGNGGGNGSGNSGGSEPQTKLDCMNGGWMSFPQFRNQGLCIAYVELQLHLLLHLL